MVGLQQPVWQTSLEDVGMIGLDSAKNVFQVHGADQTGLPSCLGVIEKGETSACQALISAA